MMWKRTAMRSFRILLIGGMILFTTTCGLLTLDEALHHPPGPKVTPPPWEPPTQPYYLDELPNQLFNGSTFDSVIIVGAQEYHGPCGCAGEGDLLVARILFEGINSLNPNESLNFEDHCSTDIEYFNCTWKDVASHRNFEKIIVIGGPGVNLGWFYYNYHKPLPICFTDSQATILVKKTGRAYCVSGFWGREGVGSGGPVTDYAIIQLYNDEGRPVLLVAGLSGWATQLACTYLSETIASGNPPPHAYGIVLRIADENGDPLSADCEIIETVE